MTSGLGVVARNLGCTAHSQLNTDLKADWRSHYGNPPHYPLPFCSIISIFTTSLGGGLHSMHQKFGLGGGGRIPSARGWVQWSLPRDYTCIHAVRAMHKSVCVVLVLCTENTTLHSKHCAHGVYAVSQHRSRARRVTQ